MTIKIMNKRFCAILFVFAIALLAPISQAADNKDTPEDVMRAGKLASAEITRLIGELRQRASNADEKTGADLNNQIIVEVDGHLYEVVAGSDTGLRVTPLGRAKR